MNRRSAGHERSMLVDHPNVTQRRRTASASKFSSLFKKESKREKIDALVNGINNLSITGKLAAKTAEVHRRGAEELAIWANSSPNNAISDVMKGTCELFTFFSDKQDQFSRDINHFLQHLRKIVETEKLVKECELEVKALAEKEKKLQKEVNKGNGLFNRRKSHEVILQIRKQLEEVSIERQLSERRLSETRAEAEVIKMFQFRSAMMGIADSYRNLATHCQAIFDCHREITELVPAVSTQDVNHMYYDGIPYTRERVESLRRSLDNEIPIDYNPPSARRRSEPSRNRSTGALRNSFLYSPPPPYTPTAPPIHQTSDCSNSAFMNSRNVNETPRIRQHMNMRNRSANLRRSVANVTPARETSPSTASSSSSADQSPPPPSQPSNNNNRLYPSLSFSSTDSPNLMSSAFKEYAIPKSQSNFSNAFIVK